MVTSWRLLDPFRAMEDDLFRSFHRLLEGRSPENPWFSGPAFPPLNIVETDEAIIMSAELPGVDPKNVEVSVTGDALTLSGRRDAPEIPEGARYHRRERPFGEFVRTVSLSERVEDEKAVASYANGILTITLPKSPEVRPRRISINA